MQKEIEVLEVNLMGLLHTTSLVLPRMAQQGEGHLIGLSSVADELLSPEGPSYHASKAGFSSYLESLGLALKPSGVSVTNLRFGFLDTKMAQGAEMPFIITPEQAADHHPPGEIQEMDAVFEFVTRRELRGKAGY